MQEGVVNKTKDNATEFKDGRDPVTDREMSAAGEAKAKADADVIGTASPEGFGEAANDSEEEIEDAVISDEKK